MASSFLSGAGQGAATGATIGSVIPGVGTAIGAVGGAIVGGIAGAIGGGKKRRARRKAKQDFDEMLANKPQYEIPDEIGNNVQDATNEAFGRPALQAYLEEIAAKEQADNLGAVGRYATSSADALAAAAGVNNAASIDRSRAAAAGQEVRQQNMGRMFDARRDLAEYKSMAWDMNVNMPFLQRMQFNQDLHGLEYRELENNINQAWSGFSQAGQAFARSSMADSVNGTDNTLGPLKGLRIGRRRPTTPESSYIPRTGFSDEG